MNRIVAMVLCVMVAVAVHADDSLTGKWTNSGSSLEFFGLGVGASSAGGYFTYTFPPDGGTGPTTNHVTISTNSFTFMVSATELRLTDSQQNETVYTATEGITNACERTLHALAGAKALYMAANPGVFRIALSDLVPAFLASVPECGHGGVFTLGLGDQPPSCSACGPMAE